MYANTSKIPTMKMPITTHFPISSASVASTTFPKRRPSVAMTTTTMMAVQMAKRLQNTRLSMVLSPIGTAAYSFIIYTFVSRCTKPSA